MVRFFSLAVMVLSAAYSVAAERPNLVFVLTDDQAMWAAGCYGNADIHTPNLDRLAKEGARFSNAFVNTPVCSPSRVSFLTARHGVEFGVTDWINPQEFKDGIGLPKNAVTWPKLLQNAGYKTALFGKWHCGGKEYQHPNQCGFDHFLGNLQGSYPIQNGTFDLNGQPEKLPGFAVDALTDKALSWMSDQRQSPFAVCLHYREPHAPYGPMPAVDQAHYKDKSPKVPTFRGADQAQLETWTRDYYSCITAVDRNLGKVLDHLEQLKLDKNTMVLFMSDHGYNIGQHGIRHKGNGHWIAGGVTGPKRPNMWDTSLRIPMLLRWPEKIKAGSVIDDVVLNLDTLPSLCGLMGVAMPQDYKHSGWDWSKIVRGEKTSEWRTEFCGAYDLHNSGLAYMRMIRTPEWKLIRHLHANGLDELYDLKNDPDESKNVFNAGKNQKIKAELQGRLIDWMKSIDDPQLPTILNR